MFQKRGAPYQIVAFSTWIKFRSHINVSGHPLKQPHADVASALIKTQLQVDCVNTTLFTPHTAMAAVITIPAGRSFRRSQSAKWVDPQPEKGIIEVRPDQGIITFGASKHEDSY